MDLLAALSADDRIPAYLELEQDPVFVHLSPVERVRYIEHALAIGREVAMPHRGRDLFQLKAELGARLQIKETDNRFAGVTIRAEHDTGTRIITLYAPSVRQVHGLLAQVLPEPWSEERVVALHVAHELFHHLEATRIGPVHEQFPPVVTFRLGRLWVTRSRARRCREIAAHAFTKELLDLPFLPNAVDWLILLSMKKWTIEQVWDALERARAGLSLALD